MGQSSSFWSCGSGQRAKESDLEVRLAISPGVVLDWLTQGGRGGLQASGLGVIAWSQCPTVCHAARSGCVARPRPALPCSSRGF